MTQHFTVTFTVTIKNRDQGHLISESDIFMAELLYMTWWLLMITGILTWHCLFYFFFWTCPNNSLYKNWRLFTIQFLLSLWLFVIWWPWPEMPAMSLWWSHVMGDPGWQFANTAEKSKRQGIWISFLVKLKSAQFLQLAQNARFLSQINLCGHNHDLKLENCVRRFWIPCLKAPFHGTQVQIYVDVTPIRKKFQWRDIL